MTDFTIKIAKAKRDVVVTWDNLPDAVKAYVVEQGLSKLLNAATTKIKKDEADAEAKAFALVEKKLENLVAGNIKARTAKTKVSGAVAAEARRLAKAIVKAGIKAKNKKISDYAAKAITEMANLYLEQHPELMATAEANVAAAEQLTVGAANAVNVEAMPVDPKKVAARLKKNEEAKAATEAKNAGKPGGQKAAVKPAPKAAKVAAAAIPKKAAVQPQVAH